MPLSKEFLTAANIKKHEAALAAARAALEGVLTGAERAKQVENYNDLIKAGRILGRKAHAASVPTDVQLTVKDPATGTITRQIDGWHIDSVVGRFPGSGRANGRMGVMLTPAGALIGFRSTLYADALSPRTSQMAPTDLTVTQTPGLSARVFVPDEAGLSAQETDGGIGSLIHMAGRTDVTPASAYEALAGFAVDHGIAP